MARVAKPLGSRSVIVRAVVRAGRCTQWSTVLEGRLPSAVAAVSMLIGGGVLMSSVVVFDFGVIVPDAGR